MFDTIFNLANQYLEQGNILVYIFVFLSGIATSFTPCIYPIIPLNLAYFSSQTKENNRKRFFLVLTYVLGLSLVYAILGMIAALTGTIFGRISTHPITFLIFANVCILLGLMMMDVINIPLPQFLNNQNFFQKKKGYIGSFLVGVSSGLIVGPCATPVLAALLGYVSTKQNIIFGASLLFIFALGMSMVLLLLGLFAGAIRILPKSGIWMVVIKKIGGIILIILGEYFIIKAGQMLL